MDQHDHVRPMRLTCCPCSHADEHDPAGVSRRAFMGGAALGGLALTGLSWSAISAAEGAASAAPRRTPLVVKPVLLHDIPTRQPQTSWRNWGGVQTQKDAEQEALRIQEELAKLRAAADFPVTFLPVAVIQGAGQVKTISDAASADAVIVYAAGGGGDALDALAKLGRHTLFFVRHKSGPVYLWYEIISPRYLRQHTDQLALKGLDNRDVVVDSQDEILWRLRALCGLKNTLGTRIIAIGGAGGWASPTAPKSSQELLKLDIQTVPYPELAKLITAARADKAAVETATRRAGEYLAQAGTSLETKREYVENAFLLEQVFRGILAKFDAQALTINSCMGTIMPMAQTSACLALSLLNDAGYLAYCESDFVVIPSGMLLTAISGRPSFLNDPTYPHDGVITLAHCTAPRRMDGGTLEPARIMTHFESDYGASPKVEMRLGQKVTMVAPDFAFKRWLGLTGEIVENPFLQICRSQVDVKFKADSLAVADKMPGFHWMMVYGDYMREMDYVMRKIPIAWESLG
ncbi:MAG: hypothetical protein ACYC35_23860 [Pirellulales bacterium]